MTSNIGVRQLKDFGDGIGYASSTKPESVGDRHKGIIETALKRTFSPEFLNRIDDIMIFNALGRSHIRKIVDIALDDVRTRIAELGFKIDISDAALEFLAEKGYDPQFGARPLHRAIQKYLEDPISEEILGSNLSKNDVLVVGLDKKEGKLKISIKKTTKKVKDEKAPKNGKGDKGGKKEETDKEHSDPDTPKEPLAN